MCSVADLQILPTCKPFIEAYIKLYAVTNDGIYAFALRAERNFHGPNSYTVAPRLTRST
jgi:hypothetical protein